MGKLGLSYRFFGIAGLAILLISCNLLQSNRAGSDIEPVGPVPQGRPVSSNFNPTSAAEIETEFAAGEEDDPLTRARWFWAQRAYPANTIPADVHQAAILAELAKISALAVPWSELGPKPLNEITYGGQSSQDASGRALTVAIDPRNSNNVLLGTAQGGLWKSTDRGTTFQPVADNMPSLAIKVIRYAPSDSNIVYAGTGEPHAGSSIYGQGVLKSTDGGTTWQQLPSKGTGWQFDFASVSGLQVHPTDPNTVYVTTAAIETFIPTFNPSKTPQTGIFKSTDGGQTWTLLKTATTYTANPSYLQGNTGFMDLELSQSDPNLLYASEYFGGIWKSTDGGTTWVLITPVKAGGGADFPASVSNFTYFDTITDQFRLYNRLPHGDSLPEFSRIELGLAQSDPNILYAGYAVGELLLDTDGDGSSDDATSVGLVFKTTDGGTTWTWLQDWGRGGAPDYCHDQCYYDNTVEVNPTNANDVMIGGSANFAPIFPNPVNHISAGPITNYQELPWRGMIYRSLDGGKTWVDTTPHCITISPGGGGSFNGLPLDTCAPNQPSRVIHPDVHGIAYDPNNLSQFYAATDGGLYRAAVGGSGANSTDYTWVNLNESLSTLQFYFFDAHPNNPNIIMGGLQDNAVAYWDGITWEGWGFGDGIFGAFDPIDPKHVYMGTQYSIHRHDSGGAKEALDGDGNPANGWKLGIFDDNVIGENVFFFPVFEIDSVKSNIVYAASETGLYQSTDRGDTWGSRLNTTATNGIPTAISASPQNDDLVWLGTAFGAIYLFDFNGAVSVSQVDKPPLPRRYITKIEASPHDENTVYVSYSGYDANTPDTPGKVLKSTDKGQTWVNISGNLTEANNLDVPVSTLAIDPANENRIWIGTDVGVYITEDGGQTWSSWRNNMPVVAIMDLKYNATTNFLMASTHGRGIWRVSGTSPSIPTHLLITPPNLQISQQGNGVIKIEVENISNLCSVDIQLRFNSSIIQASVDDVKIEPPFVASVGPISGTGFIEFKATSTTPINSDSVVASVTWHGVQLGHTGLVIEAVSPSALNLFDCNDNSINHKTGNGMIEVVPTTACDNPSTPPGATIGFCHQVQPTDTLYGLGRQYGVDPFLISRLNQLYSPNLIYDDQSLFIPEKYDGGAGPNVYIVKPGETLAGVADQCRLPVSTLAQANQLDPEATLQECQALIIPVRPYPPPFIGHPRPICPLPGRYWPPCRFCSW